MARFLPYIIGGAILLLVGVFWEDITKKPPRQLATPEVLEREIAKSGERAVWELIKQRAPADYDALLQELSGRLNEAGSADGAFTAGVTVMQGYVKRLSVHAPKADDTGVRAYFGQYHALLTAMPAENLECGKFVFGGALLAGRAAMQKYMDRMTPMAVANVSLLMDARDSDRAPTAEPSDADYGTFSDQLRQRGVSDEGFTMLQKGDWKNPAYCEASRKMADLLSTMDGPAAHRVRLSLYRMLNSQE